LEGYVLPSNQQLAKIRPAPNIDTTKFYTLSDLIDLAETRNPLTRNAWNAARDAALAVGIVRSTYLPRLTVAALGGGQWLDVNNGGVLGTSVNNQSTSSGTISAASLQWLLFDFGERDALIEAATHGAVVSNIAFTAAHQQVIYDTSLAFYAYIAARKRQDLAAQALTNARTIQSAAEARLYQQEGTTVEVAQARQATAQAELGRVRADGAEQNAYLTLITRIGLSPATQIHITDATDRPLPSGIGKMTDEAIAQAVGRRPDVLSAYELQMASSARVRAAQAEFLPKIFASGNVSYSAGHLNISAIPSVGEQPPSLNLSERGFGSTLIAGITVPLYDGGTRAALLEQARNHADTAASTLSHSQDEAVQQIVLADNAVQTSIAAYDAASSLAKAAQTTYDAAFAAYRSGVGPITAVTLAQTELLAARQDVADAYSAARTAAATLAFATGGLGSAPP
jgi:outer membrane protein TolC